MAHQQRGTHRWRFGPRLGAVVACFQNKKRKASPPNSAKNGSRSLAPWEAPACNAANYAAVGSNPSSHLLGCLCCTVREDLVKMLGQLVGVLGIFKAQSTCVTSCSNMVVRTTCGLLCNTDGARADESKGVDLDGVFHTPPPRSWDRGALVGVFQS